MTDFLWNIKAIPGACREQGKIKCYNMLLRLVNECSDTGMYLEDPWRLYPISGTSRRMKNPSNKDVIFSYFGAFSLIVFYVT